MTDGVATYSFVAPGWTTTPLATYVYSYDNANRVTTSRRTPMGPIRTRMTTPTS